MRHKAICTTKCVIGGETIYVQDAKIIYKWISNMHERYISVTKGFFTWLMTCTDAVCQT